MVSKLLSLAEVFKGRHFDAEILVLCVRWYLQYKLSYRGLVLKFSRLLMLVRCTYVLAACSHGVPQFFLPRKRMGPNRKSPGVDRRRSPH